MPPTQDIPRAQERQPSAYEGTRSDYRIIKDGGWNSQHDMMRSYGLKTGPAATQEDYDVAAQIIQGFRDSDAAQARAGDANGHDGYGYQGGYRTGNFGGRSYYEAGGSARETPRGLARGDPQNYGTYGTTGYATEMPSQSSGRGFGGSSSGAPTAVPQDYDRSDYGNIRHNGDQSGGQNDSQGGGYDDGYDDGYNGSYGYSDYSNGSYDDTNDGGHDDGHDGGDYDDDGYGNGGDDDDGGDYDEDGYDDDDDDY